MKQNTNFEKLRRKLLREVMELEDISSVRNTFKDDFFNLVELCTFSLMKGEDNFFALFIIQMKRNIKWNLATAIATAADISYFSIYFNPAIFLQCSLEEMKSLIKHEVYHIMYGHLKRRIKLKKKYSSLAINTAMDISINQYIPNMPSWASNIQNVKLAYNVDLEYERPLEEYVEIIQESIDKLKGKRGPMIESDKLYEDEDIMETSHDINRAHDLWEDSATTFNLEQIRELTKRVANNSNRGKIPKTLEKPMKDLNKKPEISWKDYLKKVVGTIPVGYKKTITRKDRRQPNRLELRGKLSNHIIEIVIAIDISGSITDKEIEQIMIEVFSILRNYPFKITIIECDDEIRRVYKVTSEKNVKKKLDTKGGTAFSPVFKYMHKNRMKNSFLIYFTDGDGEKELIVKPIHYKTLWVLTGKGEQLSLENPYGIVKRLSNVNVEVGDLNYLKNEMKDILVEWAK